MTGIKVKNNELGFLKLSEYQGGVLYIRPSQVEAITERTYGCVIHTSFQTYGIREPIQDVLTKLTINHPIAVNK